MTELVVGEEFVQYSEGSRLEDDWENYSRGVGHNGEKNDRLV